MNLLAQIIENPVGPSRGETGISVFQQFIPNLIRLSFVIGVLIFFFVMIIGAIQWISSGGDKAAIEAARGKITNAIVGIVILFALFVVLKIIGDFFGITALERLELNLEPLILD